MKETGNPPHTAVLSVQVEVYSLLSNGQISGSVVSQEELESHDIQSSFLLSCTGKNKEECLLKLKNKLQGFQNE